MPNRPRAPNFRHRSSKTTQHRPINPTAKPQPETYANRLTDNLTQNPAAAPKKLKTQSTQSPDRESKRSTQPLNPFDGGTKANQLMPQKPKPPRAADSQPPDTPIGAPKTQPRS